MDIDWFYIDARYPIHAASNGGHIAKGLYKINELQSVQTVVMGMQPRFDYILNSTEIIANMSDFYDEELVAELIEHRRELLPEGFELTRQEDHNLPAWMPFYAWSFIGMAQRGFYSFDKKEDSDEYYLVVAPIKQLSADMKEKMNEILPEPFLTSILHECCICDINDICNQMGDAMRLIPYRRNENSSIGSNDISIRFADMIVEFWRRIRII